MTGFDRRKFLAGLAATPLVAWLPLMRPAFTSPNFPANPYIGDVHICGRDIWLFDGDQWLDEAALTRRFCEAHGAVYADP